MAKAKLTLGSAERDIMQIIWNAGAPLTARQILSAIQSRRKWSLSTLMTSLSRLAAKGFVQCDRSTGTNLYTSLMTEEAFRSASAAQGAQNAQRGTAMKRTYDDTMFRDTFEHEYTWLNGFYRNVRRYAKKTAMIDPATSRSWNYNELNHEANRLAHALDADGVGKNDVVMTSLLNCPEFAFSYIAPRKLGAIVNPCNFNLSAGETALLIDHNRPKVFIYSADIAPMAAQAVELAKFKPTSVVMADNLKGAVLPEGHIAYEDYVRDQLITDPEMKVRPHIYDEVLRLCTSGTTALPKSVPVNDINEVLSAHDIIMHYPMNAYDVLLNMTPWFHRGGVHVGGPCPTFYVGASTIISRVFQPKLSLQTIEEYGVTFAMGAPSSMEMLCRAQEKNPVDLSRLKGLVTMGAPFEKAACEPPTSTTATAPPRRCGTLSCAPMTCPSTPAPRDAAASTMRCGWSRPMTTTRPSPTRWWPMTARRPARSLSSARKRPLTAITTTRQSRRRSSTRAGCTPATWAPGTRTGSSPSAAVRTT